MTIARIPAARRRSVLWIMSWFVAWASRPCICQLEKRAWARRPCYESSVRIRGGLSAGHGLGHRRRFANDQMRRQRLGDLIHIAVHALDQPLARQRAHLVQRQVNRRERWRDKAGVLEVIETDYRHVARALDPLAREMMQRAQRHLVVAREDRGHVRVFGQ